MTWTLKAEVLYGDRCTVRAGLTLLHTWGTELPSMPMAMLTDLVEDFSPR